jgi:hypothetical protein
METPVVHLSVEKPNCEILTLHLGEGLEPIRGLVHPTN